MSMGGTPIQRYQEFWICRLCLPFIFCDYVALLILYASLECRGVGLYERPSWCFVSCSKDVDD